MQFRVIYFTITLFITGCANYQSLSDACDDQNIPSCFKAADYIWNLRPTDLKPCLSTENLCIKQSETRIQAVARLKEKSVQQNALACDNADDPEACLRAGSTLAIISSTMPIKDYKETAARAEEYFKKACQLGYKSGCMFKGTTRRAGT